jgi:hypothetical protein
MFFGFAKGETYVKMKKPGKKKSLASNWEQPFLIMNISTTMGLRSRMKVIGSMLLRVRMKNCGIGLEGIFRFFILHLEVVTIEGLSQKISRVVTNVTKKYG